MRKLFTFLLALVASVGASHAAPAVAVNGKLPGAFSVSASKKVNFSQGNLQYVGTWQFAANQWEHFGNNQSKNHRDLFGWGTKNNPNKTSGNGTDSEYSWAEWGQNVITNGGNAANSGWRTLTAEEWGYLLGPGNGGTTPSKYRDNYQSLRGLCKITVGNTEYPGMIILPDDLYNNLPTEGEIATRWADCAVEAKYLNYTKATFTKDEWTALQDAGAVFLPAAGYRGGNTVYGVGTHGNYWSSLHSSNEYAYYVNFFEKSLYPENSSHRYTGRSVRLVSDIPQYTITFQNYDGTTLQSSKVYLNAIPAYTGDTPEKPSTAAYSYTFSGWSPTIAKATANATYTAQFSQAQNQATVNDVIAKINAIGEVAYTPEYKDKIDVARNAYNALTDEQKALVSNYATLEAAEARYAYLTPVVITPNEDPKNAGTYYSTYYDGNRLLMLPENVEAYVAYVQGDALMMQLIAESGDILPKATPVIFRSEEEHFTLLPQDEGAVDMSEVENALQGSDIIAPAPANTYVLSGTAEYGVGFYRINSENLKAHKAYVVLAGLQNNAPRRLRFVFNEEKVATGIENTDASAKIGGSEKVIENGELYIIKNGVKYNAQGQIVK